MDTADEARAAADGALAEAGIVVHSVDELADLARLSRLVDTVWERTTPMIEFGLLKAFAMAGGYVVAAWDAADRAEMVGGAVAFVGRRADGKMTLHSHVAGFLEEHRGVGRGRALKLHQRAWALARGIDTVEWTFDPLVRRNGWFNLQRLGADVAGYHVNCYGELRDDGINGADESDRLLAVWNLAGERATRAATGRLPVPSTDGSRLVEVPDDIVTVRRTSPDEARRVRLAVRDALRPALAAGSTITGMTRSGAYVLAPPAP